jgi:acyl-CoA thioesterase FadM
MARPISGEYRLARQILTGKRDPSGLNLGFFLDAGRVMSKGEAPGNVRQRTVTPPGYLSAIVDDLAHASLSALRKRIGVTREARLRYLKPLYGGEAWKADGNVVRENGELFTLSARIFNAREQLCIEGETEVFALGADQLRRMTKDGMLPVELRRYLP